MVSHEMVPAKHRLKSASPEKQQMDAPGAGFLFGQNSHEFATLRPVFEPRRALFLRGAAIVADSAVPRTARSNPPAALRRPTGSRPKIYRLPPQSA